MMYEMATIFDIYWTETDSGRTKGEETEGQRVNEWLMQQAGRKEGTHISFVPPLVRQFLPQPLSSTLYYVYYQLKFISNTGGSSISS